MYRLVLILLAAALIAGCQKAPEPQAPKNPVEPQANPPAAPAKAAKTPNGTPVVLVSRGAVASEDAAYQDAPGGNKRPLKAAKGPVADNSRCFVCHVNYETERLTVGHARAQLGCEKCHGPSDEHCGDEGNITPPTKMFPRGEIDAGCMSCHPTDKPTENGVCMEVVIDPGKVCTDCHGRHRMAQRTVYWDKATGKLVTK